MFTMFENVIKNKQYELRDMLCKIDTMWVSGKLTHAERETLTDLARANATPEMGYADTAAQLTQLRTALAALTGRVAVLESGSDAPEQSVVDAYPAWHTPTGAHDAYYTGDAMTYTDGIRYTCIAPAGYGVAYGPDLLPAMWEKVSM